MRCGCTCEKFWRPEKPAAAEGGRGGGVWGRRVSDRERRKELAGAADRMLKTRAEDL